MQNCKNPTIAIIDSGIGGVSVLNQIIQKFNAGNFIYLADNLYMPYGNKTKQWLKKRVLYLIRFLREKYNVDYIIIACNTASSSIENISDNKVFKLHFKPNETYLTTKLTKENLPEMDIIADNRLANQIENNIFSNTELNKIVKECVYKHNLKTYRRIVLGCTHFELVEDLFKKHCKTTEIISNSFFLMSDLKFRLKKAEINIVILLTKKCDVLEDKILKLIRS